MTRQDEIARHTKPQLFRPLIDAELTQLVELAGAPPAEARACLAELEAAELDAWQYLQAAVRSLRPLIWNAQLRKCLRGTWGLALFEPGDDIPYNAVESAEELDPDRENVGERPVVIDDYPEEAREALRQEHFWGARDGVIAGIFDDGGVARIYCARPGRFEILGDDAIEFIERIVAAACASSRD